MATNFASRESEHRGYAWEDLIAGELARLPEPWKDKKEVTIVELVAAKLEERTEAEVWRMKSTCSHNAWHRRDLRADGTVMGWKHDPLIQEIYQNALELARNWRRKRRLEMWSQREETWEEEVYTTNMLILERVRQMLQFPLQRVVTETDEDGNKVKTIIMPARWSFDSIARLLTSADKLMRLMFKVPTEIIDDGSPAARQEVYDEISQMGAMELDALINNLLISEQLQQGQGNTEDA